VLLFRREVEAVGRGRSGRPGRPRRARAAIARARDAAARRAQAKQGGDEAQARLEVGHGGWGRARRRGGRVLACRTARDGRVRRGGGGGRSHRGRVVLAFPGGRGRPAARLARIRVVAAPAVDGDDLCVRWGRMRTERRMRREGESKKKPRVRYERARGRSFFGACVVGACPLPSISSLPYPVLVDAGLADGTGPAMGLDLHPPA